jgi:ubiquitin-protein ligase E3 C
LAFFFLLWLLLTDAHCCSLSKEAFDTDRGLWLATKEQELYPNPHSYARDQAQLNWYGFIGRVLGKALYEGILVDVRFAGFFLSKWLGKQSYCEFPMWREIKGD